MEDDDVSLTLDQKAELRLLKDNLESRYEQSSGEINYDGYYKLEPKYDKDGELKSFVLPTNPFGEILILKLYDDNGEFIADTFEKQIDLTELENMDLYVHDHNSKRVVFSENKTIQSVEKYGKSFHYY